NEFNREGLIYHMLSTQGPCACHGDLDGDGVDDVVIPGAKGAFTSLFKGMPNQSFVPLPRLKEESSQVEFIKCLLFDANRDGHLDLYLAAGGTEESEYSDNLLDVIYINDGKGNLDKSPQQLPEVERRVSTGGIASGDINGDGYDDLVIGERLNLLGYGGDCRAYVLINDTQGSFMDQTQKYAPELLKIGMVTDIQIVDVNDDQKNDIVLVGDYIAPHIFINKGSKLELLPTQKELSGWWNTLAMADIDNDGDQDIILGNHGQNSRFRVGEQKSIRMYYADFDVNGFSEGIIAEQMVDGKYYPYDLRHNLFKRLPYLTKQFPDYASFKNAAINEIFSKSQLDQARILEVHEMRSGILINEGSLNFTFKAFPSVAQLSPVYAVNVLDINNDGFLDIILGGNLYEVKPEFGKYDASYGLILINKGNGTFEDKSFDYGLSVTGQVRSIIASHNHLHFFRNNQSVKSYKLQ
ncbi:MAG TPA: VCBS repeat-containing protein, partial [Saprospiraceae bacterium]|nr:VCBS repeat-containing protein [Saprospiraceae bacterium]